MTSSLSPDQYGSVQSHSSPEGTATSHDRGAGSPLNLGFLKSLTEKRTTRGILAPLTLNDFPSVKHQGCGLTPTI